MVGEKGVAVYLYLIEYSSPESGYKLCTDWYLVLDGESNNPCMALDFDILDNDGKETC